MTSRPPGARSARVSKRSSQSKPHRLLMLSIAKPIQGGMIMTTVQFVCAAFRRLIDNITTADYDVKNETEFAHLFYCASWAEAPKAGVPLKALRAEISRFRVAVTQHKTPYRIEGLGQAS